MHVRAGLATIIPAVAAVAPMTAMPEQVKRHEGKTREDPDPVLRKPCHSVSPRLRCGPFGLVCAIHSNDYDASHRQALRLRCALRALDEARAGEGGQTKQSGQQNQGGARGKRARREACPCQGASR